MKMFLLFTILISANSTKKEEFTLRDRYLYIEHLLKEGKYEDALNVLKGDIGKFSNSPYRLESKFLLGELLYNAGYKDRFVKESKKLLKDVNGTYLEPELYYNLSVYLLVNGFTDKALKYIEKLEKFPDYKNSSRDYFLRGLLQYIKGNYLESIKFFKHTSLPWGKLFEGRAYAFTGRPKEAIYLYRSMLDSFQNTQLEGAIKYGIVEALFIYEDYQGVITKGEEFLNDFPGHSLFDYVKYLVGVSYYKLGKYDEAIKNLLPLAQKSSFEYASLSAYFVGNAKMREEKFKDAIKYFEKARTQVLTHDLQVLSFFRIAECYYLSRDTQNLKLAVLQLKSMLPGGILGGMGPYFAGAVYFETNRYALSELEFKDIVENNTVSSLRLPAIAFYFASLLKEKKPDKLVTVSTIFTTELSKSNDIWAGWANLLRAEALYMTGRYEEAEKVYLSIIAKYKGRSRLLIGNAKSSLGWTYIAEERYDNAEEVLKEVSNVYADTLFTIQSHMGLAVVYFNKGDYKSAFREFSAISNTFPNLNWLTPYALYYKGLTLYAMKMYGDAVETWENLLRRFGSSPIAEEAAYKLAETYSKAAKYIKSNTYIDWLIKSFPDGKRAPRAQLLKAQNFFNMKEFAKAIEEYHKFLTLYPDDELKSAAQTGMSQAFYYESQEDTNALEKFEKAFPTSEYAAEAIYDLGVRYYEEKKYKKAADYFMRVAMDYPKSEKAPKSLIYAGQLFAMVKDWDNASSAYKKYIDFFPDGEHVQDAYFGLGVALLQNKRYKSAARVFKELLEKYPNTKNKEKALKDLGIALYSSGDVYGAVDALKKAAKMYEDEGKNDEALAIYQYIYEIAPDADIKKFAESKIKEVKQ